MHASSTLANMHAPALSRQTPVSPENMGSCILWPHECARTHATAWRVQQNIAVGFQCMSVAHSVHGCCSPADLTLAPCTCPGFVQVPLCACTVLRACSVCRHGRRTARKKEKKDGGRRSKATSNQAIHPLRQSPLQAQAATPSHSS